jgi:cleavage and polyadenylation specificity factor subunit 1
MHALRHQILPPSGVEFAASLKLRPSTLGQLPTARHVFVARALCNVVVARSNLLRIFEVREELAPISSQAGDERERKSKTRKGTEPVEGEVEMDEQGDGFVNIAKVTLGCNSSPICMNASNETVYSPPAIKLQ